MKISALLNKLNRRDTRIIPNVPTYTKISLIILAIVGITIFSKTILAQSNVLKEKQDAITKGNNQEAWINEAMLSNLTSTQIMLGGTIPNTILNGETNPQGYPITSYVHGGLIGNANNMVASLFMPQASGIEYIAQVKNEFLGKPIYAQSNGVGYDGLNKILPLWKTLRNTVYVLFSLIFVIVGVMIMLRVKVSPQAVISIQSSIPKIITALILVTFSYAIAGLCIDLMNFLLAFVLALLFNGLGKGLDANLFPLSWSDWSITNLINLIKGVFGDNAFDYSHLNNANFNTLLSMTTRMAPSLAVAALGGILGGILGAATTGLIGAAIGGAGGALILIVILQILISISIIKFIFALVKCYITIIIKIITGPFEIAIGAFPNSKMGFNTWIMHIIANLAVFPISIIFLVFINILIDYIGLGMWTPVMLGGTAAFFLPTLVGISGLLMLPKLPPLIVEFIFSIKPSPFGKAIGEAAKNNIIAGTFNAARAGVQREFGEAAGQAGAGAVSPHYDKFQTWRKQKKNDHAERIAEKQQKNKPNPPQS